MTGRPKSARAQITHFRVPEMLIAEASAAEQAVIDRAPTVNAAGSDGAWLVSKFLGRQDGLRPGVGKQLLLADLVDRLSLPAYQARKGL
jgi:hypothetical protein